MDKIHPQKSEIRSTSSKTVNSKNADFYKNWHNSPIYISLPIANLEKLFLGFVASLVTLQVIFLGEDILPRAQISRLNIPYKEYFLLKIGNL